MKKVYIIAEAGVNHNGDLATAKALIDEGKPYVVRLKSGGSEERRIVFTDGIKLIHIFCRNFCAE